MTQLDVRRRPVARSRAHPRTDGTELDADGAPVWARAEGQELVPEVAAWRRLGVGLRCETWLGWSRRGWHPVVVKIARPHQVAHPRAWASLTREVYVLTRVRHPSVPVLYGSRLDGARPHVLLEYVDGPDLADELDDGGPFDAVSAARLATQLLSALAAVHGTGAAHLDVKPENVLIRDGRPVLVDFGSARPIGSSQPVGQPVGTVGYAAPEMEACRPVSAAMDAYGVGMVLREALAGGVRTRRRTSNAAVAAVAEQLTAADPAGRPTVPEALAALAAATGPDLLWPASVAGAPIDLPGR